MAEYAVQHDADPAGFRRADQPVEGLLSAQNGVDLGVIAGIVAVIGAGAEDGVQIQHRHAQLLQFIQLFGDSPQGAAEEIQRPVVPGDGIQIQQGRFVPLFVENRLGVRGFDLAAPARMPGFFIPEETVGKNLVHHGVAEKFRRLVGRVVNGDLVAAGLAVIAGPHAAQLIVGRAVAHIAAGPMDDEIVPEQHGRFGDGDRAFKKMLPGFPHGIAGLAAVPGAQGDMLRFVAQKAERHRSARRNRADGIAIGRVVGIMIKHGFPFLLHT